MYITLKANKENGANVQRAFAPINIFFNRVIELFPMVVEETVASVIAEVFEAEGGQNEWTALAEYTQAERMRLGYGPKHPILVREGSYMQSFAPDSPQYVSEYESSGEGSFVQKIGTTNPLFPWHEKSTRPPHNMPARPATPVGDPFVYEVIVRQLNEHLNAWLEDMKRG